MATKVKAKKPRAKKAKQPYLSEEMAPPRIPALDSAAETYYEAMMERVGLSKEEAEAMNNLVEKMNSQGIERYETPDGLIVSVIQKTKAKVKKKKAVEANSDE